MRFTPSRPLLALLIVLLAGLVLTPSAWGQEERREEGRRERGRFGGRGGFGGFERGGGGMLGALRSESVQQELDLTDEQKEQIEKISESARPSGDFFSQFRELRNLSDEERESRMAEFRQQMEDRRREAENKLKEVLKEEQFTRLQQISLRNAGARGLLQDEIADELQLTDEQKTQIREILESREGFSDFRSMTPEDFQRIREEREAKALALLSDEQKQAWEKKLGPAPEEGEEATADRDSGERPDRRSSDRPRRTAASDADSGTVILPDGTTRSPMSSFGGSEEQANAGSAPTEAKRLSFNFYQAPWADVLRLFASVAGLTIDLKDVPPGTFSYYDPNEYTPTEALDIINGYLLPRGHILVRRDNFLVSLNIDDEIPPNLVPTIKVSELANRGRNELVGVILPLQPGLDPEKISKEVEGLLGPQGKAVPLASSNSIMLQDLSSNLREVTQLLSDISVPESDDTLVFKRFSLEHMPALDAERQIRSIFALEAGTRNVSRAAESRGSSRGGSSFWDRLRGGRDNDRDRDSRTQMAQMMMEAEQNQMTVSSDARTNSVLVKATAADMKLVEEVLEAIDVPESEDAKRIAGNNTPVLRVYTLGEAEADEVAKTLDAIKPGVVVNEDSRNDMVHIMATPLEHEEIEILIQRLDGAGGQTVDVIKLVRTDPVVMAQILTTLFANVDRDIAPAIQPDPMTRSLIVRGSVDQVGQIRKMLLAYGEDGNGTSRLSSGRIRSVPLAGRDPERIARMVEGILSGSKEFGNEIRVVVPSESPTRDRRVPSATRREPPENARPTRARSADRDSETELRTHRVRRPSTFMASLRDEEPAANEGADEPDPQQYEIDSTPESVDPRESLREGEQKDGGNGEQRAAARVNIEVLDGDLVIYSADEQALDEVEGLIGELANQMPSRSEWVQFYLRVADATEASILLEQMVSNPLGTDDSYGYSRYSRYRGSPPINNPQSLKIIPDVRTNSLFVSGPNDKIREVEQFLQRIDAAETPESLRDRLPRTIPVLHADILQVAQMIRDLYSTDMADPNARNDREGRGSSRPANVRLTLAVDTRASELIVSCDDALFREIEEIVYERDQAAFEGQPTVQVIELNPGSSAMVQQALTSLSPKILVSTSGTSRTPNQNQNQTDPNANRSNQSGSDNRSGDDARRDFFRQMMESRSSDSSRGSGRSGSGGGSSDWRSRFGGGDSSRWSRGRGRD